MAPPLLPITRLVACSACAQHIKSSESVCPHCGAEHRVDGRVGRAATAMLMGLALSGCPDKDPEPTGTDSGSGSTTGAATEATMGMETGSETGTTTTGMTSDATTTAMPEPEYGVPTTSGEQDYGVPATDSMSGTEGDGGTDTTTDSTTGAEPLYGAGMVVQ
jgi:hypothetical protein